MPTRKIKDIPQPEKQCLDMEHYPAQMAVFSPGVYEHECPSCHKKTIFTVNPTGLM